MNFQFNKPEPTKLEEELARLLDRLSNEDPTSDEYSDIADQVKKLYPLKEVDSKNKVSKDALIGAASSIVGIAIIVGFEHGHALTSKALGFVTKNR